MSPGFVIASLILAITPGPGVVYIVTRTLGQGRAAGLASVGGIALGNLGNALAASAGLAAVLSASASALTIVKLAGAAYLVFLGLRALHPGPAAAVSASPVQVSPRHLFRAGFLVALLNPKTALFFAAFLPQFMHPGASAFGQGVALSGVFVGIALCTDSVYVLTAAALAASFSRRAGSRRYGRYVTAASFICLGIYAALAGPRAAR